MQRIVAFFRRIFLHSHLQVFFQTLIISFMVLMYVLGSGEKEIYQTFVNHTINKEFSPEKQVILLLESVHKLGKERQEIFSGRISSLRFKLFRSSDIQFLTAAGNCGSFTHILGYSLQVAGYDFRVLQMQVGNTPGGHILLEAYVDDSWVVLDPLFNVYFRKANGKLASFKDVQDNWEYYKQQIKGEYNFIYKYEGVRYTNWEKIPIIMPAVKKILYLFYGDDVDYFSLRSYFLNVYYSYLYIALFLEFLVILLTLFFYLGTWKNREVKS